MGSIVGLCGSLRAGSYNSALLRAAAELVPDNWRLEIESIRDIPLYNADVEAAQGIPAAVARIKDAIAGADGLLLASPEYNNSLPGVAKNAVDWLTRPDGDSARVFSRRPVAVIGASPGSFGTILAQSAWLPVFRTLGADFWAGGRLIVSRAGQAFDAGGRITDAALSERLKTFLAGFVAHIGSRTR
jgi:chromate reductase, NAD(P)H dehydrogenase (quinone)